MRATADHANTQTKKIYSISTAHGLIPEWLDCNDGPSDDVSKAARALVAGIAFGSTYLFRVVTRGALGLHIKSLADVEDVLNGLELYD